MNVGELKKRLKNIPNHLEVYWADHDHSRYEWNNIVGHADVVDRSEMDESEREMLDVSFYSAPDTYLRLGS
jgi:hypothetical protein